MPQRGRFLVFCIIDHRLYLLYFNLKPADFLFLLRDRAWTRPDIMISSLAKTILRMKGWSPTDVVMGWNTLWSHCLPCSPSIPFPCTCRRPWWRRDMGCVSLVCKQMVEVLFVSKSLNFITFVLREMLGDWLYRRRQRVLGWMLGRGCTRLNDLFW